jgi:LuxR family maltose regulon positive regulatory protein
MMAETLLTLANAYARTGSERDAERALAEADTLIASMADPGHLRAMRRNVAERLRRRLHAGEAPLSTRELEVLQLLATGLSKRQVADRLFVSFNTVHSHTRTIYRKLDVGNKDEAIARANERGLVEMEADRNPPARIHPGESSTVG